MKITLDKITLSNFKGIKSLSIDFDGGNADISGQNATGKTSIVDAFMWLMFDKDSQDKKDFQIKTIGENGEPLHGVEHSVTAMLDISGTKTELKKSYYEKWTKQKGQAEKVFTGHTTDYFIDGVPVKKSDYTDKISSIVNEDTFKLLTNPLYFNDQLHWKKRRELLFEVCGDISDDDVITQKPELEELKSILGKRNIDDHKSVITSRKKKVNDELEKIPVRVDEVVKGKPDLKEINFGMVARNLERLQEENEKHRNSIIQLKNSGGVADKERRIAEIDTEVYKLTTNANKAQDEVIRALEGDLYNADMNLSRQEDRLKEGKAYIERMQKGIEQSNKELEQSRKDFLEERGKELEFEQKDTCPACGQAIPESQLEEARQKTLEQFNKQKSDKLESIRTEGKEIGALIEKAQEQVKKSETELKTITESIESLKVEKQTLETKLSEVKKSIVNVEELPEYKKFMHEKNELQKAIQSIKSGAQEEVLKVQQIIRSNEEAMKQMQSTLAKEAQAKQVDARIEELKSEEKKLAAEYARLEKEQYLIEEFIRTKVSLVESSINTRFGMVRFKLFNEQVNGALDETCETLINSNGAWVPWSSANSAGRVNAGLDIIRTLSSHYDVTAPIWIDNAESVNQLIPMDCQIISLIVSEDEELKVEVYA